MNVIAHTNGSALIATHQSLWRKAWLAFATVLLALTLIGCASQNSAEPDTAQASDPALTLGFDPNLLSTTVRPQDDFWNYVNGPWIEANPIPADKTSYGTFWQLIDRTEGQIKTLLDATLEGNDTSAYATTIGNLYRSYLDRDTRNARGTKDLQPLLNQIDAIDSYPALFKMFGTFRTLSLKNPVDSYADNDAGDGTRLILYLWQSGLGLPNRDYYLSDAEKLAEARTAYKDHIRKMLARTETADTHADAIFALENAIANLHWTQVESRNREKIYSNQYTWEEAQALTGAFDLAAWFEGFGYPTPDKLVLAQTSYFEGIGELARATPLAVWRDYLKLHLTRGMASFLDQETDDALFDFQGRTLRGQEQQTADWKRAVRFINRSAGELLGRVYVAEYFPPAAKGQIADLVENLRTAYGKAIDDLQWMSNTTKSQARGKLAAFLPKLGYPDQWRDFSALETGDNLVNNVLNARRFNHAFNLEKLDRPVDRQEWTTNPQTVNAFYRPTHNSITFPAGILQAPMFDANSDPAMNYGAIGSIIGHEFSHGFDDQGRKFDGAGLLRNWWTDTDAEQYKTRAGVLVEQYNNFSPLPDTNINGQLTLGENIGDLAGITMAYRAFELSGYADGPSINGLTPRQRFFIAYAVAFRSNIREGYLRELLLRDSHSPGQYRVIGVLRNMPEFHEVWDVQQGDGMYLPPLRRVKIW